MSSICFKALCYFSFSFFIIFICIVFDEDDAILLIDVILVVILLATSLFISINRLVERFYQDNTRQLFSAWEDRLEDDDKALSREANFCIKIIRERIQVGNSFLLPILEMFY